MAQMDDYGWYTGFRVWLTEKESLHNAQLVANFFLGAGWTPRSISAMLGNMRHESSINPQMYEYGYSLDQDRGYGLVQWTPMSKYVNWTYQIGSESLYHTGVLQLARIAYERWNAIQWYGTYDYQMTFMDFSASNESIDYLTNAFCWCYERPNRANGLASMPARIAFAKLCLQTLDWGGGFIPPIDPEEPNTSNKKNRLLHLYLSDVLQWG